MTGHEGCSPLELILRLMEGVAREEVYCSEDLLLRVVGWKELVTRTEKAVGWNVKPSPSHVELSICSGVSLQVSESMMARSDLSLKICGEGTHLPPLCMVYRLSRPIVLHCKLKKGVYYNLNIKHCSHMCNPQ